MHTRFEEMEIMDYSPLSFAYEQTNVAVTGEGTLDGQAGEGAGRQRGGAR